MGYASVAAPTLVPPLLRELAMVYLLAHVAPGNRQMSPTTASLQGLDLVGAATAGSFPAGDLWSACPYRSQWKLLDGRGRGLAWVFVWG